jgi:hypothetical protein
MKHTLIALGFTVLTGVAQTSAAQDIDCTLAPSQNAIVNRISGTAGGATATAFALGEAMGLSVVAHSSGAYILTGSGGYIAGTLGTAVVGPIILGVGLVVGGVAVTVEVLCAPKNHPAEVAKVREASSEFMRRSKEVISSTPKAIQEAQDKASVIASNATIKVKQVSGDIYKYAYQSLPVPK